MSENKYQMWVMTPPPATRFYQQPDGSYGLYFEKSRAAEMVKWAEDQLATYEYFLAQMQRPKAAKKKKRNAPTTVFDDTDIQTPPPKEELKPPTRTETKPLIPLSEDPGYKIALEQQAMLDAQKGVPSKSEDTEDEDEDDDAEEDDTEEEAQP